MGATVTALSSSEKHADCATPNGHCLVKDPENMKKRNKKGETRGAPSYIVKFYKQYQNWVSNPSNFVNGVKSIGEYVSAL